LLAEASNKATANDWLTLILAKGRTRYEEMSPEQLQACLKQTINLLNPLDETSFATEPSEDNPFDEPSRFPFVNQDDPNKPGVGDQF
jgi:hypothetical protein